MRPEYSAIHKEAPEAVYQLTVVTVCWNALPALKSTTESVLRQKAGGSISIEHVVVDGASTDGTPEWLAEQLAAGNIERYVSEPDRGIYDAMNKGINLARGRVVLFLNADDELTDADLRPCVQPIIEGRCTAVAACADVYNVDGTFGGLWEPNPDKLYIDIFCCHQAFFAAAAAYRRLGGYDAQGYKTAADSDMMDRICAECPPLVEETVAAKFKLGGFSQNCNAKFRDEFIEFFCRGWEHVRKRCAQDAAYRAMVAAHVYWHCRELRDWQRDWQRTIPRQLESLQRICRELSAMGVGIFHRPALRWIAGRYLPALMRGDCAKGILRGTMELIFRLGRIPSTNPYAGVNTSAIRPPYAVWLWQAVKHLPGRRA